MDLIRVKNMLNSTISMSYSDVNTVCIEHMCPKRTRAIEVALVKYDNNMKDYSLVVDLLTTTANHSNYLVCDRANTQSVTVRKVKLQLIIAMPSQLSEFTISSRSEGRTRDVHSHHLIDVYALSDVSLRRQASMTQAEKFLDFLLKSDVNLFNHLVRKRMLVGCCSAGSVLR